MQDARPDRFPGLALTLPVAMGYIPLGAVFGFLFVQAGAPWWLAVFASVVVFAGAAQYMMIPLVVAGTPLGSVALATLVVNLRHAFYGLSLLQRLPPGRLQRWYVIFGLTDETYSVLTTMPEGGNPARMTLVTFLNHLWWVSGSTLGALIGARAQITLAGLDFALVALFAVLVVEQWKTSRNPRPLLVALASYGFARYLFAGQALVVAILLTTLAGLVWHDRPAEEEG